MEREKRLFSLLQVFTLELYSVSVSCLFDIISKQGKEGEEELRDMSLSTSHSCVTFHV